MNSTTTQHPNMKSFDITCNGITKLLKQLNPYKAPGPDSISPRILKEPATDISPLLQLIFQKSLDTGVVLDDWCIANVSSVYKKGQKSLAENYRPISLTSVCCKTMEHILASKIIIFCIRYNMDFERATPVKRNSLNSWMTFPRTYKKANKQISSYWTWSFI
jgi:hypothetical protein